MFEVTGSNVDPSLMKSAADSLLPIVQSQRERFRVRAQELETVRKLRLEIFSVLKVHN